MCIVFHMRDTVSHPTASPLTFRNIIFYINFKENDSSFLFARPKGQKVPTITTYVFLRYLAIRKEKKRISIDEFLYSHTYIHVHTRHSIEIYLKFSNLESKVTIDHNKMTIREKR